MFFSRGLFRGHPLWAVECRTAVRLKSEGIVSCVERVGLLRSRVGALDAAAAAIDISTIL